MTTIKSVLLCLSMSLVLGGATFAQPNADADKPKSVNEQPANLEAATATAKRGSSPQVGQTRGSQHVRIATFPELRANDAGVILAPAR